MAKKKVKVQKQDIIEKLKRQNDAKFRKKAKSQGNLITSSDLNSEMRSKIKVKVSKGNIKAQQNRIEALQKENKKISRKIKDLKEEYPFADDERKKEIKRLLLTPDYIKKDLFVERNLLKYLKGEDFDFIINDSFKKYTINTKELKKYWKKGKDASIPILKQMKKDTEDTIKNYDKIIKKESKTASKSRIKSLKRVRDALQNKLDHTINKNIEAVETGNMNVLDEYNDEGNKAYSLLFEVVGFNVDRIGI